MSLWWLVLHAELPEFDPGLSLCFSEYLDEDGHEYDKGNAHKKDSPPEFSHPLNNGQKSFLIE